MAKNQGAELDACDTYELWSLREDIDVEFGAADDSVRLRSLWGEFTIPQPSSPVLEAIQRMCLGPVSLENIAGVSSHSEADAERRHNLLKVLGQLQPLVVRSVRLATGQPLLSVIPTTVRSSFHPRPLAPDIPVRLSSFAALRTDGREFCLESPLALHRVMLHRPEAVQLISMLGSACTPTEAIKVLPDSGQAAVAALEYLIAVGMVAEAKEEIPEDATAEPFVFAEDTDLSLAGWTPADLTFHSNSTFGRHDRTVGATYPMDDAGVPWSGEPVVKPSAVQPAVSLHRPSWDDLCAGDPPLTVAVEGRQSVREHGGDPVTLTELGDLLYRTSRVRSLSDSSMTHELAPRVVGLRELSDRPYPGGGACYELELYVTAGECEGLPRGVYHYDPLGHYLEPVSSDVGIVEELLQTACSVTLVDTQPQVLITMTARIQRLSWKYEGMPYRIALVDAGVLIQNLYLVCTAMGLAPCALGGVSSELSARAFGADWRTEPSIMQFTVGRPAIEGGHSGMWHPTNDGDWADQARALLKEDRTSC